MDLYIPRIIQQKEPSGITLKATLSGKYKVEVCRNGQVVRKPFGDRWFPNLITNVCLDQLMQGTAFNTLLGSYCRAGSGVTPPANTDTQLTAQLRSTNTFFTGGGTGTTIGTVNDTVNGAATHTLVYEFAAESSSVTYNEIGLASSAGPTGGSLYTHSLLSSGVSLVSGDNLRLTYALTFSFPATVTPVTVSLSAINGFNISGQLKVVGTFANIFGLWSSASTLSGGQDTVLRNSATGIGTLYSAPTTFPGVNTVLSGVTALGSNVTGSLGTYTAGSFTRTQQFIWVPSNPASTASNVAGFIIGTGSLTFALMLLLSSAQTKANTNTLTVNVSSSIARA